MPSLSEGFKELDRNDKGYLSVYDLEDILVEHKRSRQSEVIGDVEVLMSIYDKQRERRIYFRDFMNELTPKQPL